MFFLEIRDIEELLNTVDVFRLTRLKRWNPFCIYWIDQDLDDEVSSSKRIPVDREAFFLNHIHLAMVQSLISTRDSTNS